MVLNNARMHLSRYHCPQDLGLKQMFIIQHFADPQSVIIHFYRCYSKLYVNAILEADDAVFFSSRITHGEEKPIALIHKYLNYVTSLTLSYFLPQ